MNVGMASTPSSGPGSAGCALEVEEHQQQLHAADAVGHRVVHLHHHRGPAVAEALDERVLPQRSGAVEAGHRGGAREVEHGVVGRLAHADAAQVVHEVEVLVARPVRRTHAQQRRGHPLAHPRDRARSPRSMRDTRLCQSGARSKNRTVTIVDRSSGSFSMFHMSASESLMWASKRSTSCGPGMRGSLRARTRDATRCAAPGRRSTVAAGVRADSAWSRGVATGARMDD